MGIQKFTLGELCTIERGTTGILKAIPGKYPLVVTGEERKSHNEFQFDDDAVIIPLVSGTGHGHASIKRIHYQTGKFALGSILCAVIPKDKLQLNAEYLYYYLDLNRENELVARMRGMANVTLPMKEIGRIEVPLPSIDEQRAFVKKYKILSEKSDALSLELYHQLGLVKKLRQQLLQDAIQGKLVKQDLNDEPASVLFQRIEAEKKVLIKNKRLKKEKDFQEIHSEEIPFHIPENWVWCRLGSIIYYSENLDIQKSCSQDTLINYVDIDSIDNSNQTIREVKLKPVSQLSSRARRVLKKGYIVYSTVRPYLKNIAIIESDMLNFIGSTGFNVFKTIQVYDQYIFNFLLTPMVNENFKALMVGFNSPSITNEQFENTLVPIPPFAEQQRIIQKLNQLMQTCDMLEASIKQSQQQNQHLLQQVLREALNKEIEQEVQLIGTADVGSIDGNRYKALLLAAEIIWQLNQRQTLGHIKLQKLIYLCNRTQKMNLPVNFLKWAMGPYDPELQKYIDKTLVENEWFKYDEDSSLKYQPLKRAGGHKPDFDKYFASDKTAINHLIQLFENAKSARIEIVATLFACWDELIAKKQLVNDNSLLAEFYNWSEKKKKHTTEKVIDALRWMETQGIVPN
jgi:type I restriction enzyme, S subunit